MRRKINVIVWLGVILIAVALIKMLVGNNIKSVEDLQRYMESFGVFGPLALTIFQGFQVVVPVVPGYLGCAAGAIAFGPFIGFWCNYIGICAGSIIAFFLGKRFGMDVVMLMFSQKVYDKWSKKIEQSKSYDWFLFAATLLPLFPDDFFCYFSGLIKMNAKKFIWIILLGKPLCILVYSIVFGLIK